MDPHLTDDLLNEHLDGLLSGDERAGVEAHLARCAACAARHANLRALFVRLDRLPIDAEPLTRDLAPGVLAQLPPRGRAAPAFPVAPARPRVGRGGWLRSPAGLSAVAQMVAAGLLLAVAWPFAASLVVRVPWPAGLPALGAWSGWLARAQPLWQQALDVLGALRAWPHWLAQVVEGASPLGGGLALAPAEAGLAVAAAALLWLAGNLVLLRRSPSPRPRRR
jgi:anti-sigma factor RsiW